MSHTRLAALTLALLACSTPRLATAHGDRIARSGPYSLEVIDEAGRTLPTFQHRGRTYVLGKPWRTLPAPGPERTGGGWRWWPRWTAATSSTAGRRTVSKPGYLIAALGPGGHRRVQALERGGGRVPLQHRGALVRRPDGRRARRGRHRRCGVHGSAAPAAAAHVRAARGEQGRGGGRRDEEGSRPAACRLCRRPRLRLRPGGRSAPGSAPSFGEEHGSRVVEVAFERDSPPRPPC